MTGLQVWLHPSSRTKISCQLSAFSKTPSSRCGSLLGTGYWVLGTEYWLLLYTRRRFGGRQPLCGIGVVSLIDRTSIPAEASARTADSRPEPGPLTRTSTVRTP